MTESPVTSLLSGFQFVPSDGIPSITLDNQRRFYINSSARRLLDIKPYQRLAIAYNPEKEELAIVKHVEEGEIEAKEASALATSAYNVDKRYYMSARHFSKEFDYEPEGAPYTFAYSRGKSDGTVAIFKRLK